MERRLTNEDCRLAAIRMQEDIKKHFPGVSPIPIYGVPKGGIPVAYLLAKSADLFIVDDPLQAEVFVDDIIDSGHTRNRYINRYRRPFFSLTDYLEPSREKGVWIIFPWEVAEGGNDTSGYQIVTRLLQYVGENPRREGLHETPVRVLKAWREWCSGYGKDPQDVLKCFEDGSENYDQMIMVKDIPFYSTCEHHMAPFFGTSTIAYIPNHRVVGLSKLSRVLDIYARRLQVQERLTTLVADALQEHLKPKGVGVLIRARHLCMESRGISQQGHHTITSALRGEFMDDHKVRDEFLSLAK